ncbi:MAG: trypsin-like peptidase domain-containing protein [Myxococcales bacterium]|nr:trypsin-like peptidase domain-containing protein [Myxococcales bacterium]
MKRSIPLLLALAGCVAATGTDEDTFVEDVDSAESAVIFDDLDIRFLGSPDVSDRMRDWADGVAILVLPPNPDSDDPDERESTPCRYVTGGDRCHLRLRHNNDPSLRSPSQTLAPLCSDELLANHYRLQNGQCTAFYVGDDAEGHGLFVTAGHCIVDNNTAPPNAHTAVCNSDLSIVFNYQHTPDANLQSSVSLEHDVYHCDRIVKRVHNTASNIEDYAVFRVVETVTNHRALPIRRSGGLPDQAMVIGHPRLMPKAVSLPVPILTKGTGQFFTAPLDQLGGNSGSPVFDPETGIVHGILVSGPPNDLVRDGSCVRHRRCEGVVCRDGATSTSTIMVDVARVAPFIPLPPPLSVRGDLNANGTTDRFVVRRGAATYEATIELDGAPAVVFDTWIPLGTQPELEAAIDVVLTDMTLDGIDDLVLRIGTTRLFLQGRAGFSLPAVASWSGLADLATRLPVSLLSLVELEGSSVASTGGYQTPFLRVVNGDRRVALHGASTGLAPTFPMPSECGRTHGALAPDGSVRESARALAFVAGDSVFGNALIVDCPGSRGATGELLALSPRDGSRLGTLRLDREEAWGSFTYRPATRDLLAIQQTSPREVRVFTIGLDAPNRGKTTLRARITTSKDVRAFGWDARTNELVMIEDSRTLRTPDETIEIVRYSETGILRSSTSRTSPCNRLERVVGLNVVDGTLLGSCAAASGFGSYETIGRLVRLDGAGSIVSTTSDFVGDLTCDTSTYFGKTVVWGIGIGGAEINGVDVPASACQAPSTSWIRPIRPILTRPLTTRF